MADYNYYNRNGRVLDPKMNSLKTWESMYRSNPYFTVGAILGQGLGNDYWNRKENNRVKGLDKAWQDYLKSQGVSGGNGVGADEKKGVTGVPESAGNKSNDYYASMNKAFDEYRNGDNGRVLYEGRNNNAPRTPQQNNTSGVTVGNVDNGGGVTSVADAWNKMANGSGYNPGNTTMFTNGARNLGNVIGADANGVYGVPGANPGVIVDTARGIYTGAAQQPENSGVYIDTAKGIYPNASQATQPAGPTPYTDDQLRQIQGQNFSAEELAKMASPDELARMIVMMRNGAPAAAAAPAQGGGILTSAANRYSGVDDVKPPAPQGRPVYSGVDDEKYDYIGGEGSAQDIIAAAKRRDDERLMDYLKYYTD